MENSFYGHLRPGLRAIACSLALSSFLFLQEVRFLLLFLLLILGTVDMVRSRSAAAVACALFSVATVFAITFPLYSRAEALRFSCLEGQYAKAAQTALVQLETAQDTDWGYTSSSIPGLARRGRIIYRKQGDTIAIYFSTLESFFSLYGYLYAPSEPARELFRPSYDLWDDLTPQWSYVKLY